MIRTAHDHLTAVITGWGDLRDLVTTRSSRSWLPTSAATCLQAVDPAELAEILKTRAAARADVPGVVLGDRPVPLRLDVLDTITDVETALTTLADQIAAGIQRSPLAGPPVDSGERGWSEEDRARRVELARADSEDPGRWSWTRRNTAPDAARWLMARLTAEPGPYGPLSDEHRVVIARTARTAAEMMERTLGIQRTTRAMDRPCPWCTGTLLMTSGGDDLPLVRCDTGESCSAPVPMTDGRREWRGPVELAALEGALNAAARRASARDRQRQCRARGAAAVG